MTTSDTMRWYLLNSEGLTISDVIVSGPYTTYAEAESAWQAALLPALEVALLDSNKVTQHIAQDEALHNWLKDRRMFNPLS